MLLPFTIVCSWITRWADWAVFAQAQWTRWWVLLSLFSAFVIGSDIKQDIQYSDCHPLTGTGDRMWIGRAAQRWWVVRILSCCTWYDCTWLLLNGQSQQSRIMALILHSSSNWGWEALYCDQLRNAESGPRPVESKCWQGLQSLFLFQASALPAWCSEINEPGGLQS